MSDGHAFIAPSSMEISVFCTAYPHISAAYPNKNSDETEEGSAGHWVLEEGLLAFKNRMPFDLNLMDKAIAPNGVIVDEEMVGHIQKSYDHVVEICETRNIPNEFIGIEKRLHMTNIHPDRCWGTCDVVLYDPWTRTIIIRDLKYGFLVKEAYMNWQLLTYLFGAWLEYPDALYFDIGILQPRPYHRDGPMRFWTGELNSLGGVLEQLKLAVYNVFNNPMTTAGEHCKYCPAKLDCDAFLRSTMNAIYVSQQPFLQGMTNQQLVNLHLIARQAYDSIKSLKETTEDMIVGKINAGERMQGVMLRQSNGARSYWAKPEKIMADVCKALGIENVTKIAMKTPIQVLDSLPKKDERRTVLSQYLKLGKGTSALIPDDGREAEKVFK